MFAVVVWLDVFDWCNVDSGNVVCCLDVKFWETPLMLDKTLSVGWKVLLPALSAHPNTALVMNVFTKETKLCPAFPSPEEAAADWAKDANGCYTVKVER